MVDEKEGKTSLCRVVGREKVVKRGEMWKEL